MRILALTDIHGNWRNLNEVLNREHYDLILVAGDLSDYGGSAERVVTTLRNVARNSSVRVIAVVGNMDSPKLIEELRKYSEITVLHGEYLRYLDDYLIVGLSGGLHSPFHTPFELGEDSFKWLINGVTSSLGDLIFRSKLILLTHTPPYNTKVDLTFSGAHVGSKAIREFIEGYNPLLVVCGHIHEGRGSDYIRDTLILNPGPLFKGYYGLLELSGGQIRYELKKL